MMKAFWYKAKSISANMIDSIPEKKQKTILTKKARYVDEQGNAFIVGSLFVDDEVSIRSYMKDFLEFQGYTLTMAENGQTAYDIFREDPHKFDLIITDMTMPKMNGAQLAERLLALRPDIPVIFCTGYTEKLNEASAEEMGIRKYLHKPIAGKEMCIFIREILDKTNKKPG